MKTRATALRPAFQKSASTTLPSGTTWRRLGARGLRLFLKCLNGDRTKLDALHCLPRLFIPFHNPDTRKTGLAESIDKLRFRQGAGDTAAPKLRVALEQLRHRLVGNDIRNRRPSARSQHAIN